MVGIPVRAAATGGHAGRSIWASVDELSVTVREANAAPTELYCPRAVAVRAASSPPLRPRRPQAQAAIGTGRAA